MIVGTAQIEKAHVIMYWYTSNIVILTLSIYNEAVICTCIGPLNVKSIGATDHRHACSHLRCHHP